MGFDITKKVQFVLGMSGDDAVKNATKGVTDGFLDTDKAISLAKSALVGLAGIASVNVFKDMVMGVIDATGKLHDLSIQSGMSVAALAQFKGVGAYTQTAIEDIVGASNKLSKSLAGQNEESKGAAQAIRALGLDFNAFKAMSPEQQTLAVAKAMNQFADGAGKSATAMMLYGREGAKLLPFFQDLADESDKIEAALTDQEKAAKKAQAAMADAFGDNLTALQKNGEGWKKELSLGLLPAMYEVSEVVKTMVGGTGGLREQMGKLAADGTLADWGRNAVTILSYFVDVGQAALRVVTSIVKAFIGTGVQFGIVMESIFGQAGAVEQALAGNFSGAFDRLKAGFREAGAAGREASADIENTWGAPLLGKTFRDRMDDIKGVGVAARDIRPDLDVSAPVEKTTKAIKAATDGMVGLVGKIGELIAQQALQLTTGDKLTASEKLRIEVMRKLTGAEREAALAALKVADAQDDLIANAKAEEHAVQALYKARQQEAEQAQRRADDLVGQVQRQEEENLRLGMTAESYEQLQVARLKDQKRLADLVVQQDEYLGLCNAETEAHRQTAQALADLVSAKEQNVYLQGAQAAVAAWKSAADAIGSGITSALADAFSTGGNFFEKLWRGVVATFKNTTLNLAVNAVQSGISSVVQGVGSAAINGYNQTGSLVGGANSVYRYGSGLLGGGATYGAGTTTMAGSAAYGGAAAEVVGAEGGAAAAGTSMAAYAGYAALIAAAAIQASKDYDAGYNRDRARSTGTVIGDASARWSEFTAKLGLSDKWADILGGATLTARLGDALGLVRTQHQGSVVGVDASGRASTLMGDASQITANYSEGLDGALRVLASTSTSMVKDLGALFGNTGSFTAVAKFASDGRDPSIGQFALQNNGRQIGYVGNGTDYAKYADDAAAALDAYANDVAGATRDALNTLDLPEWARQTLADLGSATTFVEVQNAAQAITAFQHALTGLQADLTPLGGIFGRVAGLSSDALKELTDFAGGIEAFAAKAGAFVSTYYSQSEQAGIGARTVLDQLTGLGIDASTFTGLADMRQLVESVGISDTAGRQQLAALLDVAQSFADVGKYLEEQQLTLGELAAQAPALAILDAKAAEQADTQAQTVTGLATVDASVQTTGSLIVSAVDAMRDSLETGLASLISASAETARLLAGWDNGGTMAVSVDTP